MTQPSRAAAILKQLEGERGPPAVEDQEHRPAGLGRVARREIDGERFARCR